MSGGNGDGAVWVGELVLPDETILNDLRLTYDSTEESIDALPLPVTSLQFLAFVDPNRIPLHLAAGPNLNATSSSVATLEWLSSAFQCERGAPETANRSQCEVAVLAKVPVSETASTSNGSDFPRTTEILLYAVENGCRNASSLNVILGYDIFALPLSSDLLYVQSRHADIIIGTAIAQQPAEKRDRLGDLFDAASDRRKKAKRKGGESISLAASRGSGTPQPQAFDGRMIKTEAGESDTYPQAQQLRATARSNKTRRVAPTTVTSSRPASRANTRDELKIPLSQSVPQSNGFEDKSFETRNRQVISRTVMAGMRIYGLQQQRKHGEPKTSKQTPSQISEFEFHSQIGTEMHNKEQEDTDSEYKGVYHQAYKGTVFAFRHRIGSAIVSPDSVREVADRLLALFCQDPL